MKIKLIAFNGRYIHSCLALFYVREELQKNFPASEVELYQFTINDPYYETLLRLSDGSPDALFFSTYIWNSELVAGMVADLLRIVPQAKIVLGGPQASVVASEINSTAVTVVHGEIEGIPPSFYHDLENGTLLGAYTGAPGHPFPSPYTEDDLAIELTNRHVYYESSRGCPFNCSYCLSSVTRGVSWKDLPQVKNELAAIISCKPKIVKFVDRTFNAKPDRALEIFRFLAGQRTGTVFHFEMAPDRFSEEMFEFLAGIRPGLFQFELGIQSTNPATLVAINRQMDVACATDNIRRLAGMENIHLHADLILGLPGESREGFLRSFLDVFAMRPHYIQMGLLKVLPGTAISGTPGLVSCVKPPYQVLANQDMDHQTLSYLYRFGECVEAFHNNRYFSLLFKYLRDRQEDIGEFFAGLLSLCLQRDFFSLSHTQELLTTIFVDHITGRADEKLLRELLCFDWLRCGHRFLPPSLDNQDLNGLRQELGGTMGQNQPPLYDYQSRSEFFKKSIFAAFSAEALRHAGLSGGEADGVVCFFPGLDGSIHSYQQTAILPKKM